MLGGDIINKEKIKEIIRSKIAIAIISGVICFGIGFIASDSKTKPKLESLQKELKVSQSKVAELQEKVDDAKPWFDLKESSKNAKEKLKQEKKEEVTEEAKKQEEDKKANDKEKYNTGITYNDLESDPTGNKGKYVKFSGKVLQVVGSSGIINYRMAIDGNKDQVVLVRMQRSKLTNGTVFEGDTIEIEGVFTKKTEYTTQGGSQKPILEIIIDNYYK